MAWFLILPLSLMAGPAGLAVALACFLASRQKASHYKNTGTPSVDQIWWEELKRQPLSLQTIAFVDKHF